MMRLRDFPTKSGTRVGWVDRVSVEASCCRFRFHMRRIAVLGLFRNAKCSRCGRRAFVFEATSDRDWSRWGGDLAERRIGRAGPEVPP
jgi:hypothetical protein